MDYFYFAFFVLLESFKLNKNFFSLKKQGYMPFPYQIIVKPIEDTANIFLVYIILDCQIPETYGILWNRYG
jgi:hypothetical protein